MDPTTGRARDVGAPLKALRQEALALWHAPRDGQGPDVKVAAAGLPVELSSQRRHRRLNAPNPHPRLKDLGGHHDRGCIAVHLSYGLQVVWTRWSANYGLALPASQPREDRGATTPVGIFTSVGQEGGDLVPALRGLGPLEVEGWGDGLTRYRPLPRQTSRVQRRFRAWRTGLRRTSLKMVRVRAEGGEARGDARGLQERLQGTGPLGIPRVEAVYGRVHSAAECHLPAPAGEVSDLPRAEPRGQVRETNAVPVRGLDADEPELQRVRVATDRHVGSKDAASAPEDSLREQGIEVGPRAEGLAHLSPGARVDRRLPVVFEADATAHTLGFTRPEACQTRLAEVGQQAVAPPGLSDLELPAVRLAGWTAVVAYRRPAAHGEDVMPRDRRVLPRTGTLLAPGSATPDGRGIAAVPLLHARQRSRPIDRRRPGLGEGAVGQGFHASCAGRIAPPLDGRPRDPGHLTLQGGPPDVGLLGPAWRSRRDDPRSDPPPQVQCAWSLDDATRRPEALALIGGPQRFEHMAYLFSGHAPSLRSLRSSLGLLLNPPGGVTHAAFLPSRRANGA